MKTRPRRSTKPAPPAGPAAIGLTDVQKIERLPRFGPGLKVKVPLHLWPIYRRVYGLEELPPNPDPAQRTAQTALLVKRVAQPKQPADSITWCCMECINQPELLQPEMIKHMQKVHRIETANATGIKNLVMRTDSAGVYRPAFEWTINGFKFLSYEPEEKVKS